MVNSNLSWPLVIIVGFVLASITFLAYEKILSGDFVGTILGTIVGAIFVGHYSTKGNSGA